MIARNRCETSACRRESVDESVFTAVGMGTSVYVGRAAGRDLESRWLAPANSWLPGPDFADFLCNYCQKIQVITKLNQKIAISVLQAEGHAREKPNINFPTCWAYATAPRRGGQTSHPADVAD